MAIEDTLDSIRGNIEEAYSAIEKTGRTVPAEKNLQNLGDTLRNGFITTVESLKEALDDGTAQERFPANTLVKDTYDGHPIRWVVGQYGKALVENDEIEEGVFLFSEEIIDSTYYLVDESGTPLQAYVQQRGVTQSASYGPVAPYAASTLRKHLIEEMYPKLSDSLKGLVKAVKVPYKDNLLGSIPSTTATPKFSRTSGDLLFVANEYNLLASAIPNTWVDDVTWPDDMMSPWQAWEERTGLQIASGAANSARRFPIAPWVEGGTPLYGYSLLNASQSSTLDNAVTYWGWTRINIEAGSYSSGAGSEAERVGVVAACFIPKSKPAPVLTDWGMLYTTEYPKGKELTEADYNKLGDPGSATSSINFSFGSVVKDTITRLDFGTKPTFTPTSFMSKCTNFNSPLDLPANLTTINNSFLSGCTAFNSPVVIPNKVTKIGDNFLSSCSEFNQPLSLPSTITSIGSNFLGACMAFNQELIMPSGIKSIPNSFMTNCSAFNGALTLPSSATSIGTDFLRNAGSFNQPLSLPAGLTTIGGQFLYSATMFNQPIQLPDEVTSIGSQFLYSCTHFNSTLTLGGSITQIPDYFLYNAPAFNKPLSIPSGVTTIGDQVLYNCSAFNSILTLPSTLQSVGSSFMYGCSTFNQALTLPANLATIGASFMSNCSKFAQALALPSSLASLGTGFMYQCNNFIGPLNVGSYTPTAGDMQTLAALSATALMYTQGVTLQGSAAQAWKELYPDMARPFYRKLIVA